MLCDFSDAPYDSIERLMWLSGVRDEVVKELAAEWQRTYFRARQEGRLSAALSLGLHSRKRVLAYTRAQNEATGRQWRWGDGLS